MIHPKIAIIILNWNGWEHTKECLSSVFEINYPNFTIILIDNGSDNDQILIDQWAKHTIKNYTNLTALEISGYVKRDSISEDKNLIFIRNEQNDGFAKANNIGIRLAKKSGITYVYLLNNDTVSEPDSLMMLMQHISKYKLAAVVPQIRYFDEPELIWCCGGEADRGYEKYHYKDMHISNLTSHEPFRITFGTGCALLMDINQTSFLAEKFFFGEEDFELALRMKKKGGVMACVVNAIVYHKESSTINAASRNLNKIYVHRLNRLIDLKDNIKNSYGVIIYRSVKFFLLMCIIEKIGIKKSFYYSFKLLHQALVLTGVDKKLFFEILSYDIAND